MQSSQQMCEKLIWGPVRAALLFYGHQKLTFDIVGGTFRVLAVSKNVPTRSMGQGQTH